MSLAYVSGEEVLQSDRILYAGEAGIAEFVAKAGDPETAWYREQHGLGCMIRVAPFGSVYLTETEDEEDLELVARADSDANR